MCLFSFFRFDFFICPLFPFLRRMLLSFFLIFILQNLDGSHIFFMHFELINVKIMRGEHLISAQSQGDSSKK